MSSLGRDLRAYQRSGDAPHLRDARTGVAALGAIIEEIEARTTRDT